MPRLTALDEYFVHQIPEPLPSVVTHHQHWRESLFFVMHPRDGLGDVVILTMALFPARGELDSLQLGMVGTTPTMARHVREAGDDPHSFTVGPVQIEIVEAYRTVRLQVSDGIEVPVAMDITFSARTPAYGLRRGTMRAGHELIWDQSHMFQSGTYRGTYTHEGRTYQVDDWWGQRDHSWGIRDHARCPFWMWLAVQLPDGMLGVWLWELANGARIYTDGCFAPADGGDPIPIVDVQHQLEWIDLHGRRRQLRARRRRGRRRRRARRHQAGRRAGDRARRDRPLGPALRPARRWPQPGRGDHRRRPPRHRHLRAHRRPPPPLLPDPAGRQHPRPLTLDAASCDVPVPADAGVPVRARRRPARPLAAARRQSRLPLAGHRGGAGQLARLRRRRPHPDPRRARRTRRPDRAPRRRRVTPDGGRRRPRGQPRRGRAGRAQPAVVVDAPRGPRQRGGALVRRRLGGRRRQGDPAGARRTARRDRRLDGDRRR